MPPGDAVDTRSTPWKGIGRVVKPAICLRNFAMIPLAGTVSTPVKPVDVPESVVSSKFTVTELDEEFAIAIPVSAEPACCALKFPDDSA